MPQLREESVSTLLKQADGGFDLRELLRDARGVFHNGFGACCPSVAFSAVHNEIRVGTRARSNRYSR